MKDHDVLKHSTAQAETLKSLSYTGRAAGQTCQSLFGRLLSLCSGSRESVRVGCFRLSLARHYKKKCIIHKHRQNMTVFKENVRSNGERQRSRVLGLEMPTAFGP